MTTSTLRAASRSLALLSTIAALAACADQPSAPFESAAASAAQLAAGDVITVTSTGGGSENGSLRWAVAQATGGEIIRFAPALAGATITLDTTLYIFKPMTIEGPADKGVTITTAGRGRVMRINMGSGMPLVVTLRNLSITGGNEPTDRGGGIAAATSLTIENSAIWGNRAKTIAGIDFQGSPPNKLTLVNSTVSNNVATIPDFLRTILSNGDLVLINTTVAGNNEGAIWGDIFGSTVLRNSILARNGTGFANCVNTTNFVREGRNLTDDTSCGDATVMIVADPKLDSLQANGGPAPTRALHPSSPAVNAGTSCSVAVDQRYAARDAQCDLGAYEVNEATAVTLTVDGGAVLEGTAMRVSGTVRCSRNGDSFGIRVQAQQQKTDAAPGVVRGTGEARVTCTTAAKPWSALVAPTGGAFKTGAAAATAATFDASSWVTPASASQSLSIRKK